MSLQIENIATFEVPQNLVLIYKLEDTYKAKAYFDGEGEQPEDTTVTSEALAKLGITSDDSLPCFVFASDFANINSLPGFNENSAIKQSAAAQYTDFIAAHKVDETTFLNNVYELGKSIESVRDSAIDVTGTGAVSVTGSGTTKTVGLTLDGTTLSQSANGLKSELTIVKSNTATEGYAATYYLADGSGTQVGAAINILKDQFLKSASLVWGVIPGLFNGTMLAESAEKGVYSDPIRINDIALGAIVAGLNRSERRLYLKGNEALDENADLSDLASEDFESGPWSAETVQITNENLDDYYDEGHEEGLNLYVSDTEDGEYSLKEITPDDVGKYVSCIGIVFKAMCTYPYVKFEVFVNEDGSSANDTKVATVYIPVNELFHDSEAGAGIDIDGNTISVKLEELDAGGSVKVCDANVETGETGLREILTADINGLRVRRMSDYGAAGNQTVIQEAIDYSARKVGETIQGVVNTIGTDKDSVAGDGSVYGAIKTVDGNLTTHNSDARHSAEVLIVRTATTVSSMEYKQYVCKAALTGTLPGSAIDGTKRVVSVVAGGEGTVIYAASGDTVGGTSSIAINVSNDTVTFIYDANAKDWLVL